jgi:hypothetical protein
LFGCRWQLTCSRSRPLSGHQTGANAIYITLPNGKKWFF